MAKAKKQETKIAICYDFDGTLSPNNMQEVSFVPALGMTTEEFWKEVKQNAKDDNMDEILSYVNLMIDKDKDKDKDKGKGIPMSVLDLTKHGKGVQLFKGVETWFDRIDTYAKDRGLKVEHFAISSGIEEIIRGTSIGKRFDHIFASRFKYKQRNAVQPATAVNYTNKTQFLFRINKGIFNYYENDAVNQYTPNENKYVHFSNMIYIGDGETDVPCMKMIMYQGGQAIAVYNPDKKEQKEKKDKKGKVIQKHKKSAKQIAIDLYQHERANFIAPTDYSPESQLEKIVKNIIESIRIRANCFEIKENIKKDIEKNSKNK